ncbi:hypothetical protein F4703DRAFT_1766420 [Phycomyces blakesleeanus]
MIFVLLSLTVVISLLTYSYHVLANYQHPIPIGGNILLLTAHPDDECMFFGPTLRGLGRQHKNRIHVLCLSTGNADGLGQIRKRELVKSSQVLGIQPSHVRVSEHSELQDGMKSVWPTDIIAQLVNNYVSKQSIDTIITFDGYGVSGHPNHIAAYEGAKRYIETQKGSTKLYTLDSIPLVRKYIGIGDLITSSFQQIMALIKKEEKGSVLIVSSPGAYFATHKAMRQHTSQLVWFRWLYVTFSRYMYVNELSLAN